MFSQEDYNSIIQARTDGQKKAEQQNEELDQDRTRREQELEKRQDEHGKEVASAEELGRSIEGERQDIDESISQALEYRSSLPLSQIRAEQGIVEEALRAQREFLEIAKELAADIEEFRADMMVDEMLDAADTLNTHELKSELASTLTSRLGVDAESLSVIAEAKQELFTYENLNLVNPDPVKQPAPEAQLASEEEIKLAKEEEPLPESPEQESSKDFDRRLEDNISELQASI